MAEKMDLLTMDQLQKILFLRFGTEFGYLVLIVFVLSSFYIMTSSFFVTMLHVSLHMLICSKTVFCSPHDVEPSHVMCFFRRNESGHRI